jgi:hypothetical protein
VVPQSQQDVTPPQQNVAFPILRHNTPVVQTQQHQCTGTNTETSILALSQKRRAKKKKKKKKDEEPKLDLANIMKLSGECSVGKICICFYMYLSCYGVTSINNTNCYKQHNLAL